MDNQWERKKHYYLLLAFLVSGILIALDTISYTKNWPIWVKLLIVAIVVLIGFLIIHFQKRKKSEKNPKATEEKPKIMTQINDGLTLFTLFLPLLLFLGAIIFLVPIAIQHAREIGETPPRKYSFGLTFNPERYSPDISKIKILEKGKTYDLFEIEEGQHWRWYFDHPVAWRIIGPNEKNPSFQMISHHDNYSHEEVARKSGILQVKNSHARNRLEFYRLVRIP